MVIKSKLMTAEEFFEKYEDQSYELIDGVPIKMSPTKSLHGIVTHLISSYLGIYIIENNLGYGFAAETGFLLSRDPDNLRAADFAFVSYESFSGEIPDSFFPIPPDLAVEVISQSNTASEIRHKVNEYLAAGVKLIWIIYPKEQQVEVYRPDATFTTLSVTDKLDGEEIISGFSLEVAKIFPTPENN